MTLPSTIASLAVAAIHSYIFYLEAFLWTKPKGLKTFGLKPEFAEQTKTLALNQGLYNGFLSAGLIWGVLHPNVVFGRQIELFFCGCVVVAGVVGGLTAKPRIFLVQGVPGIVAGVCVWLL